MWHANDGMGWWMVFVGIFWILFWASVVYLFVAAVVRPGRDGDGGGRIDAIEIAKRRLARGEITPQEFQEIRRHLESDLSGPQPT
jgi:uncharacterized membrane protein